VHHINPIQEDTVVVVVVVTIKKKQREKPFALIFYNLYGDKENGK
jgi:hypothetical protein